MSSASITIRTILVFVITAFVAVFVGYIAASPVDWASLLVYGFILLTFSFPFLLRWHYPLMIAAWNMNALVFILPGRPPLWLFMVLLSLTFSLGYFALNKGAKYLSVPRLIYPLLFLVFVVLGTAKLTGGIGIGSLGGETSGGKRYFFLIGAILGYFALTCHHIPLKRAYVYVALFFVGGVTAAIGNLLPLMNPAFYFIFYIFPPEQSGLQALGLLQESTITRLNGLSFASSAIFCALLACYGIRGIFDLSGPLKFLPFSTQDGFGISKPWRLIIFLLTLLISLFGGFRSVVLIFALTFFFQFFFERIFRTRLFPVFIITSILASAIALPLAHRLPLSMQRALSVVPFVEVDPVARMDAKASSEWRIDMWKQVLPQVPQYLFLGKGYGLKSHEIQTMNDQLARGQTTSTEQAIMAGDYHNGPLSVIIPFGIWGVIAFVWFLVASIKVLLANYRHGDPVLRNVNRFLLAYFIARTIFFFTIFGSLFSDIPIFIGVIGLSVALNGGMRRETLAPVEEITRREKVLIS